MPIGNYEQLRYFQHFAIKKGSLVIERLRIVMHRIGREVALAEMEGSSSAHCTGSKRREKLWTTVELCGERWISQLRLPTNPDDEFHVKNPTNDWQPGCSHAHYSESGHARVRNGAQSSAHSEERPEKVEPGLRQELIQKQQRTTIYC